MKMKLMALTLVMFIISPTCFAEKAKASTTKASAALAAVEAKNVLDYKMQLACSNKGKLKEVISEDCSKSEPNGKGVRVTCEVVFFCNKDNN